MKKYNSKVKPNNSQIDVRDSQSVGVERIKKTFMEKEIDIGTTVRHGEEYADYLSEEKKEEIFDFFQPYLKPTKDSRESDKSNKLNERFI